MDINNLKIFSVVAKKLNFVATANEFGVDPSSISRKITQIEKELGASLFNRNTRSITLTAYGEKFLKHTEVILQEYERALENAEDDSSRITGVLRVTASVAFSEMVLAPIIKKFLDQHKNISVQLIPSDQNLDLANENIDVAVRLTPKVSGDYIITKLFQTKYGIYGTPGFAQKIAHLDSPEDMLASDTIMYELPGFKSSWRFRRALNHDEERMVEVKGRLASSSPLIIRKLVLMSEQPAILANWLVKEDVDAGRLNHILPEYECTPTTFDTGAWIVYVNKSHIPMKIKAFVEFLKREVPF